MVSRQEEEEEEGMRPRWDTQLNMSDVPPFHHFRKGRDVGFVSERVGRQAVYRNGDTSGRSELRTPDVLPFFPMGPTSNLFPIPRVAPTCFPFFPSARRSTLFVLMSERVVRRGRGRLKGETSSLSPKGIDVALKRLTSFPFG